MKKLSTIFVAAVILISLGLGQGQIAVLKPVQKIVSRSCGVTGCHQGKYPAMNMSFEPDKIIGSTINVPSQEKPDLKIISTAEPAKSYLLMKIRGDKDIAGKRMPLNATSLKDADIQALRDWILSLKNLSAF
jgi:hypothetical protein